ncbi:MAG: VWA domain-containing protein [Dysgonamonadaceae bacterium]|jgi:Ca-activated chloride channel family protein|nr:VWA domain-containing protein [Dysgonamonadaceae bacterium]MDD3355852.1 VWA domain-containing protein [Dysgonamonadaceae bacterium]MDD3727407.1 VWA domain-containing protein [Dysgonamonadaceae bacterium]MDD4246528.1 VWA domain-containing protein [Dysgonamonadaceae bacterium]MDD4605732.1 VWA domain-containing protein [Dysgonamonadaceae bacterium]
MFRFAHPEYLYLFIALPFVFAIYIYLNIKKRKDVSRIGTLDLVKRMMPELSLKRSYLKFWIIFLALVLGILLVAGLQFGTKVEKVEKRGIELVIAVDVSNSMMARDVAPDRLSRAKQMLSRIIDSRKDDQIALIVFAGDAYVQMPLTSDTQSAKLFLNSIDPSLVPIQGTVIGKAIELGVNSFSSDKDVDKAIILITDAEDHEGNATQIAKQAADAGIMVNVIGIGSVDGSPIPESSYSDKYKTDTEGNIVVSKLNEQMAREIAQSGKGLFVHADNTNAAMNALESELNKLQTKQIESLAYSEYDEKFPIIAWILLIVLIVEVCIFDKKNRIFRNIRIFKR